MLRFGRNFVIFRILSNCLDFQDKNKKLRFTRIFGNFFNVEIWKKCFFHFLHIPDTQIYNE